MSLWKHQEQGLQWSRVEPHLALFWEMGTGKTRAIVEIWKDKCVAHDKFVKVLILSPKVVCRNWRDEFKKFSHVDSKRVYVLDSPAKRKSVFAKGGLAEDTPAVVIVNYDALQNAELRGMLFKWKPELVVCDESQRIKNFQAKRTQGAIDVSREAYYRFILSGTPILNSPEDLFAQYLFLDGGKTFGTNYWAFKYKWFEDKNAAWKGKHNYFPNWQPITALLPEFNKLVYRKAMRKTKEECLDLPPLVKSVRSVDLGKDQAKAYEQMKKEFITFVQQNEDKPKAVVAQLAITKSLRLQQIVQGFATTDEGETVFFKDNPRAEELRDLLTQVCVEMGEKCIVWANFKASYEIIRTVCKDVGIEWAEIHGETKDKYGEEQRFKKDKKCKVVIANQVAAGLGINLVEAPYTIYYGRGYSYGDDEQSESRNHRGGSEIHKSINRVDIVAHGTIDELGLEAIRDKQNISERILDWRYLL